MKENNVKKFDIILSNPPYGSQTGGQTNLYFTFTYKYLELSNKILVVIPAKINAASSFGQKLFDSKHVKEVELVDNKLFNISLRTVESTSIFNIDVNNKYESFYLINLNGSKEQIKYDKESRKKYMENKKYPSGILNIIDRFENLYNELKTKYKTMCDDNDDFIYEENKAKGGLHKKEKQIKLSRVKSYLKNGKYKYCLYKGSFNNKYNQVQEFKGNYDIFNGQVCWLTKYENVKNNIKYWMESPLFDLWRQYYMGYEGVSLTNYYYSQIPALNFNQKEDKFKKYVNSLNNFTDEEIKVMIKFNIHNADKL